MILELCDRWGKLPSEVRAEGADVFRMTRLVDYARGVTAGG